MKYNLEFRLLLFLMLRLTQKTSLKKFLQPLYFPFLHLRLLFIRHKQQMLRKNKKVEDLIFSNVCLVLKIKNYEINPKSKS